MSESPEPIRVPDAGDIAEGHALKVLFPSPDGGPPGEFVLCRVRGKLHALDSECPHEGGRLAGGPLIDGETVHCPLHLFRFRPETGAVVDIDCPPAKTYPVVERDGVAEVWVYGIGG